MRYLRPENLPIGVLFLSEIYVTISDKKRFRFADRKPACLGRITSEDESEYEVTMRNKLTKTTTDAIGYLTQKDALDMCYTQENNALFNGRYGRPDDLRKVRCVIDNMKPGSQIIALVCKYKYHGTVLGFRYTSRRGWVMGMILKSGRVKDVSIDPRDWFDGKETTFVYCGKTVYAIYKHGYRLALEPVA